MANSLEFGWWIQSVDDELYGPVTFATLQEYLRDGVISTNTPVKHCTHVEFTPVLDLGLADGIDETRLKRTGDSIAEHWPRRAKDRLRLAESEIECAYHRRPAILTCIRCHAPYCIKCQMKSRKKPFPMCRKCQTGIYNRRAIAYLLDGAVIAVIAIALMVALGSLALEDASPIAVAVSTLIQVLYAIAFLFRDSIFSGAGPGKRATGLKVVSCKDGQSPLNHGQAFTRWISLNIPFFNLVDLSVPYRDPLQRRYGDRWAKTRVIDTDAKLERARQKVEYQLASKHQDFQVSGAMSPQDFARLEQ